METITNAVERGKGLISVLELKRLLVDLKEKRPDICIRYRLLGEMWVTNNARVIYVTENGVLLNDERSNRLVNLTDLSSVMQFEIDAPFQGYEPHFHYHVKQMLEFV